MIRVNLKHTKVSADKAMDTKSTGLASEGVSTIVTNLTDVAKRMNLDSLTPGVIFKMVINLILILCFPLGLKIYEINQINKLEKIKKEKEHLLKVKNQKLLNLSQKLESYAHLQEKAKEYQKKKDFLKKIAEDRIIIARTLDIIQSKTPDTVWLKDLHLTLSEKNTKVSLSGKSFKESHINAFADSLNEILDKDSITVSTRDVREGNSVVNVEFDLEGLII